MSRQPSEPALKPIPGGRAGEQGVTLEEKVDLALDKLDGVIEDQRRLKFGQSELLRASQRLADEVLEARAGVPPSWRGRVALVALAAALGGLSGTASTLAWGLLHSGAHSAVPVR